MAAPLIQSVTPAANATGIVLGTKITVTFDQLMDTSTINEKTFSLTGPGQTSVITPDQLISDNPDVVTGREYITGTFAFSTVGSNTVVTFTPSKPLQENKTYTVLVIGSDSDLTADYVKNLAAEAMVVTYQWSFTSGYLNVVTPPVVSPIPALTPRLVIEDIKVTPRQVLGNDLSQEIDITFKDPIDTNSFNLSDVLISIDAMLGDPLVTIPPGLAAVAIISSNVLRITITGW
jgi:hypothetical protein